MFESNEGTLSILSHFVTVKYGDDLVRQEGKYCEIYLDWQLASLQCSW
jgi:hypothetical protein